MADPLIPRAHLFGNPKRLNATISPDGTSLAWVAPLDGVMNVWIAPHNAPAEARPVTRDTGRGVRNYDWPYDGRHLLFLQDRDGDENWRLHAVNLQTGEIRALTPEGVRAVPSGISRHVRDAVLVTLNQRDPRYPDLFRVELATGAITLVAENPGFASVMADDRFEPRLALQSTADGGMDLLRPGTDRRPAGRWTRWDHIPADDVFASHVSHLGADGTTVYMFDSRGRDTAALVAVDLATGARQVLAEHDRADISSLITDRNTYAPLAYGVTVERQAYVALDPRLQPDLEFMDALEIGEWSIMSRSEDDQMWIVGAHADTQPGTAYLYDRTAHTLRMLYRTRPELTGALLAPMHPVTIPARDGLELISYLTLPPRLCDTRTGHPSAPVPMVLLVHGGPWARDVFGYNPYAQWLANRGYAVLSVNFRGSTGLGKRFVNAGNREWGQRMDDDLLDALAWAVDQRIADPARIAIFGVSYGGYAVLAGMTRNPDVYACGVDVVGPSNLETLLATVPPYWASFRAQLVRALGDPETEEGRALLRERSPLHRAGSIRRPLMIAQGANDPRVKQAESDRMAASMHANRIPVTYLLFPDEGHGFVRPENQLAFAAVAETFLAECLGGQAEPMTADEAGATSMQVLQGIDPMQRVRR